MGLGFAKDFVIFLFIAVIIALATENWNNFVAVIGLYAVVKVTWRFLT